MYKLISIDLEKCTGCRCCELACSTYNAEQCNPEKARIRAIKEEDDGRIFTFPVMCQHCEQAPCIEFCPTGAMKRDNDTNAVIVNENTCIGCKKCMFVCPFGAPFIDENRGIAIKCNLCNGSPKCVEICPKDALNFIDYEKLNIERKRGKVTKYLEYLKVQEQ